MADPNNTLPTTLKLRIARLRTLIDDQPMHDYTRGLLLTELDQLETLIVRLQRDPANRRPIDAQSTPSDDSSKE